MLFRHYKDTICLLNAIWTQRGHYERRKKSRRRVGVNAPPRTRAKIGEGYPSERQSDTPTRRRTETSPKSSLQATFLHEPTNEPRATKKHDTDETTPPQCHRGQTSDKSDDERTPRDHLTSQKTSQSGRRHQDAERRQADTARRQETASGRHQNAERATLRHHAHALTHNERRRTRTHERTSV